MHALHHNAGLIHNVLPRERLRNFGNYNATYGSLGAAVVLLTWLYLSAFVVLLGAQINTELERQTTEDTTTSGGKPIGQRGAFAADTIGPSYDSHC